MRAKGAGVYCPGVILDVARPGGSGYCGEITQSRNQRLMGPPPPPHTSGPNGPGEVDSTLILLLILIEILVNVVGVARLSARGLVIFKRRVSLLWLGHGNQADHSAGPRGILKAAARSPWKSLPRMYLILD